LGQRRSWLGLTQAELRARLGISANAVARWERGELALRSPELVTLALERLEQTQRSSAAVGVRKSRQTQSRHNLPHELHEFVGREAQLIEVRNLLGRTRLLTLTGSGGVGKTGLAQRLAAEVLSEYPHGLLASGPCGRT
jgi:transcriptional regulator with XRE-family HTH domain